MCQWRDQPKGDLEYDLIVKRKKPTTGSIHMRTDGIIFILIKNYETKVFSNTPEKEIIIFSCINYKFSTVYQSLF